jgi:hypothetical protein
MAVKVTREPQEFLTSPAENCFSCYSPTHHWHEKKDVPCCVTCARRLKNDDAVPTKKEWINSLKQMVDGGALGKFFENLADGKIRL